MSRVWGRRISLLEAPSWWTGLPCGMSHLRRISVFVEEPEPGHFHWILHESTEDATVWTEVQASEQSYCMWLDAFDAGVVKHVDDERIGPRTPDEDEDAAPVGPSS